MKNRIAIGATICHVAFLAVGCARQPEPSFTISSQTQKLKPEFQKQIVKILAIGAAGRLLRSWWAVWARRVALASRSVAPRSTRDTAFNAMASMETATAWLHLT